jgi:hypothetical protein
MIAVSLVGPASAQTYITEDISADTTWGPGGSPYIIQADIVIGNYADLTIAPGTTVKFDGDYELQVGWLSRLFADGSPGEPILFTSNAPSPAMSDWDQVTVIGPDPSSFTYCTFEYADIALYLSYIDPPISYCNFRNCRMGIAVIASSPPITHCNLHDGQQGIFITNNLSRPTISDCNLYNHTGWNVHVEVFPAPLVTIDATNNWWGVTDASSIADTIHDHVDDAGLMAIIDFDPWLGGMPVGETTWGGVKARYR